MSRAPRYTCASLVLALVAGCDGRIPVGRLPRDASAPPVDSADLGGRDRSPVAGWAISVGAGGEDGIWNIVVDPAGDLVVSGFYSGTVSFGATTLTATADTSSFVGKLDPAGHWRWAVHLDGRSSWVAKGIDGLAVDAKGYIYYAGEFSGAARYGATTLTAKGSTDLFVAKFDPQGSVLWAVPAGGSLETLGSAAAVVSDGQVVVGGRFSGTATFGTTTLTSAGHQDLFVAKLDSSGQFLWAIGAGSDSAILPEAVTSLVLDAAGRAYLTGGIAPGASFGGKPIQTGTYEATSAFAARLAGSFTWVKPIPNGRWGSDIKRDPLGNLHVASVIGLGGAPETPPLTSTYGLITKLSDSGDILWSKQIAGDGTCWSARLLVDEAGRSTVVGYFSGTMVFGDVTLATKEITPFLARLDSTGRFTHAETIRTTGQGAAVALARDAGGNVYVSGQFAGTGLFGGTSLTSAGGGDGFLWNMGPLPD